MVANTSPIYSRTPDIQWIGGIDTANTGADLTSGTSYLVFTADATEGGFLREIRIKPDPDANTGTTVVRIWINNGSSLGTAANSAIFAELALPATVAGNTVARPDFSIPMNVALPPGYRIYLTLGQGPGGGSAFNATAIAGKY